MRTGTISILGCGWLGKPLGNFLARRGFAVKGSTTRTENFPQIVKFGISPYLLKVGESLEEKPGDFFSADVIILSIPPSTKTAPPEDFVKKITVLRNHIADKYREAKTIFISSTSVYRVNRTPITESDEFVNRDSPLYNAEQLLREIDATIVRFAGLVGPGRHPGRFLSGKTTAGADEPVNLIHLNDCIGILDQIIGLERWGRVYNACADKHPSRKEFYDHACDLLELPRPVFTQEPGRGYKIISNEFLKRDLHYNFEFPDPLQMTY